jgi:hypothetical protein
VPLLSVEPKGRRSSGVALGPADYGQSDADVRLTHNLVVGFQASTVVPRYSNVRTINLWNCRK